MKTYDVIIVGARCAGSPLAIMLAQQGLSVCVIDKANFPSETPSTSAFQSNGIDVLRRIGVLDRVMAAGPHVIKRATVTSTNTTFSTEIDPATYGTALGMRRSSMDAILVDAARDAGADMYTGCAVTGIVVDDERVVGVSTKQGEFRARLVVGADGRHSTIARAVNAREYGVRPAGRMSTWAFYEGVAPDADFHFGVIGDRELPGSAAYLGLPLDGCFLASVNIPMDQSSEFLTDRYARFDAELHRFSALAATVDGADRIGPIRVLQKWHNYFRTSAGPGWVLVGDAGHFKDYSLGQGHSDAFRQAEQLSAAIARGLDHGGAIDAETRDWWAWRDRDAWQMYWANCLLGEPYLPEALADAAFGLCDRRPDVARHFAGIFNKSVSPLRLLTPIQLAQLAPQVVAGTIKQSRHDRGRGLKSLADVARFSGALVAQHPRSRLRRLPEPPALAQEPSTAGAQGKTSAA